MVLTTSELIALLRKEVRVLLHLTTKVDLATLDYRPTPKQRSTIELLRYLTTMGPGLVRYAKGEPMDAVAMSDAVETASKRSFDETVAVLAAHADVYAELLREVSDDDLRGQIAGFDGSPVTRGQFLVDIVFGQLAAYRMQLFLYLKASGREELNTMNLQMGIDAAPPA